MIIKPFHNEADAKGHYGAAKQIFTIREYARQPLDGSFEELIVHRYLVPYWKS